MYNAERIMLKAQGPLYSFAIFLPSFVTLSVWWYHAVPHLMSDIRDHDWMMKDEWWLIEVKGPITTSCFSLIIQYSFDFVFRRDEATLYVGVSLRPFVWLLTSFQSE